MEPQMVRALTPSDLANYKLLRLYSGLLPQRFRLGLNNLVHPTWLVKLISAGVCVWLSVKCYCILNNWARIAWRGGPSQLLWGLFVLWEQNSRTQGVYGSNFMIRASVLKRLLRFWRVPIGMSECGGFPLVYQTALRLESQVKNNDHTITILS